MKSSQRGFTILELMIAISIFSVILIVCSMVLIGIGNIFAKGANVTNVQNDARSAIADITSTIQFSGTVLNNGLTGGGPNGSMEYRYVDSGKTVEVYAYCFGDIRYSFVTGSSFVAAGGFAPSWWPHELWKDQMVNQNSCSPLNIGLSDLSNPATECGPPVNSQCTASQSGSGTELTGSDMHLGSFVIGQVDPSNSQLYSVSIGLALGSEDMFTGGPPPMLVNNQNYQCNDTAGQQYCATSYLSTFAMERLQQ